MKPILTIAILSAILISKMTMAQTSDGYFKTNNYYSLSLSANESQQVGAIGWNHLHSIGKKKKFNVGYGIRFSTNFGSKTNFITAPSKLTSGTQSPLVIFADNKPENFDTISFSSYNTNSLNLSIHLNYAFSKKFEAEFNIDAFGFSFGGVKSADYLSSKRLRSPNTDVKQDAKPTSLNALLISDNDIGNLNSEILVKYWFTPQLSLKLGATFIFAEYTTTNKLFLDNNRFRNKVFLPMIGISWSPFKNRE